MSPSLPKRRKRSNSACSTRAARRRSRAMSCRAAPARSFTASFRASARARFTAFAPTARGARTRACASTRTNCCSTRTPWRSTGRSGCMRAFFASSALDSGPFAPKAVAIAPDVATPQRRRVPWPDTILYELHVRGFTRALAQRARGVARNLRRPRPSRRARPSQAARRHHAGADALRRLDRRAPSACGGADQLLGL